MAPGYRAQNRRQTRTGYVDHDVFEGLPIRHWRRDTITITPTTTQDNSTSQNDIWAIELPHGMPKDSHLLPQHSQDLLRAARSGRIYKRPAPVEEEEVDPEVVAGDKPEKKEEDPKEKGFTVRAWKQVPRHLEGPDIEYLAKRRKGLITAPVKDPKTITGPTLTKTTVRRTDAAGNEYVQHVVAPHGQQVEGEVISQTVIPDPFAAASLAADGLSMVPTPSRRKPPPPRRKPKGPGRGRKKKHAAPTSVPGNMQINGAGHIGEGTSQAAGPDGIKAENENGDTPTNNEDTEMAEDSVVASDDDDGEEGDEGEEGEGDDDEEGSLENQSSPAKANMPISPAANGLPNMGETPDLEFLDTNMSNADIHPSLIISGIAKEREEGLSGSPLKNVVLTASGLASPIEFPTATSTPFSIQTPAEEIFSTLATIQPVSVDEEMEQETLASAPTTLLPPPPPEPTAEHLAAAVEMLQEEEDEEEMLLDIVENAGYAQIAGSEIPVVAVPEMLADPAPFELGSVAVMTEAEPATDIEALTDLEAVTHHTNVAEALVPPTDYVEATQPEDDDDDFPDLLGSLEKQLNKPFDDGSIGGSVPVVIEQVVEPEEPAESAEPAEPAAPAATVDPVESLEPGQPPQPVMVDSEIATAGDVDQVVKEEDEEVKQEAKGEEQQEDEEDVKEE